MNNKFIIDLEEFKSLLSQYKNTSSSKRDIRTKICKKISYIEIIIKKANRFKVFTIGPPPAIGGYIMPNVNPFTIIFDSPYYFDAIGVIIDMIDETIGYIEENKDFTIEETISSNNKSNINKSINRDNNIFIVHGHDNALKEQVARFLEKLDIKPIILHEQSNKGATIIEKFEKHSNVNFAIILFTPDDVGNVKEKESSLNLRARQNVIFELGYFMGKIGRENVCVLIKDKVEKPTDYDGIIYIPCDNSAGWKMDLAKEIKNAGFKIDLNKVI